MVLYRTCEILTTQVDLVLKIGLLDRAVEFAAFELQHPQLLAHLGDIEIRAGTVLTVVLAQHREAAPILFSFWQALFEGFDARVILSAQFERLVQKQVILRVCHMLPHHLRSQTGTVLL